MLDRARGEFERRIPLDGAALARVTPCERWTVRDVLTHVIVGNRMAVLMLTGHSRAEVEAARDDMMASDQPEKRPIDGFAAGADAQATTFASPGALTAVCHTLVGGAQRCLARNLRDSAPRSASSGAKPKNPPWGIASPMWSSASTFAARSLR